MLIRFEISVTESVIRELHDIRKIPTDFIEECQTELFEVNEALAHDEEEARDLLKALDLKIRDKKAKVECEARSEQIRLEMSQGGSAECYRSLTTQRS